MKIEELPVGLRFGLGIVRERNYRLEITDYHDDEVFFETWQYDDTVVAQQRVMYLKNGIPYYREIRNGTRMPEWRVHAVKSAPVDVPAKRLAKKHRRPRIHHEVQTIVRPDTVQSLFVRRTELLEEYRKLDHEFVRNPEWDNMYLLDGLRQALHNVEERIIVAKEEAEEDAD